MFLESGSSSFRGQTLPVIQHQPLWLTALLGLSSSKAEQLCTPCASSLAYQALKISLQNEQSGEIVNEWREKSGGC